MDSHRLNFRSIKGKVTTRGHFEKGEVEVSLFRHSKHPSPEPFTNCRGNSAWFDPSLAPRIRSRSSIFLFKLPPTIWRRSCDKQIFELSDGRFIDLRYNFHAFESLHALASVNGILQLHLCTGQRANTHRTSGGAHVSREAF